MNGIKFISFQSLQLTYQILTYNLSRRKKINNKYIINAIALFNTCEIDNTSITSFALHAKNVSANGAPILNKNFFFVLIY